MAPTNDTAVTTEPQGQRYVEDPNFVPNPTEQFGTLDTSGTAGSAHSDIKEVTPIFKIAEVENAQQAARALDPDDDSVDASLVVMPVGQTLTVVDEESIKKRITEKAAATEPVAVFGPTDAQEDAAKTGEEGEEIAQAQQETQGAATTTTGDPEGAERQSGGERTEETTGLTGTADTSDTGGSPEAPIAESTTSTTEPKTTTRRR